MNDYKIYTVSFMEAEKEARQIMSSTDVISNKTPNCT